MRTTSQILGVTAIMLAATLPAKAQFTTADNTTAKYTVGQTVEFNGVPATVFYVDDMGHGLAFTFPAYTEKEIAELIKDGDKADQWLAKHPNDMASVNYALNTMKSTQALAPRMAKEKGWIVDREGHKKAGFVSKNKKTKIYGDLANVTDENGSSNHAAIMEYATKEGLDIEKAFPAQAYCRKLGEGWFIPGTDELEKLSKYLWGHFGETDTFSDEDFQSHMINRMTGTSYDVSGMVQTVQPEGAAQFAEQMAAAMKIMAGQYALFTPNPKKDCISILSSNAQAGNGKDAPSCFQAMILKTEPKKIKFGKVKPASYYSIINAGYAGEENVLASKIVPVYRF